MISPHYNPMNNSGRGRPVVHKRLSCTGGSPERGNKCFMHDGIVAHSLVTSLSQKRTLAKQMSRRDFTSCVVHGFCTWFSCPYFGALYASESLDVTLIKSLHFSLCVFNENFQVSLFKTGTVIPVNGGGGGKENETTCFGR
jgi:hypothetical protein